ncbi:AAA family ATPase [Bradyrhizobium sp. Mp27]|uniref:AAA family ATPase n=1 Tax=Bradyrhizobium sp. Mp27 TaxID=3042157 RepID=UPI00248AF0D6|nr:AAA family ATPase [Bradyrhizobium sp. Mp27]MDI2073048.1 AAA family ATPase [Bradyrhizobium sp. Mp27]
MNATAAASVEHPFIGLLPFGYWDHEFFFGRNQQINILEPLVAQRKFVAIVGTSGSGKSSLVRAGLLPRLERREEAWSWIEMHPGKAPIRALAEALGTAASEDHDGPDLIAARTDRIELLLHRSSFGLTEAFDLLPRSAKRWLIVVDQFEELFRFTELNEQVASQSRLAARRRDEATAFVQLILAVTNSSFNLPIHIVVTMRSDFIGECARFHGLPEAVSASQYLVPGLTRDQRAEAISAPVMRANGQIDMELIQKALNDTTEDVDQLPILQHVMMRCWQQASEEVAKGVQRRPRLTVQHYRVAGEAGNALSVHANEVLRSLKNATDNPVEATSAALVAKRLFQSLTDVDKAGRVTRRPQRFKDLLHCALGANASEHELESQEVRKLVSTVIYRFAEPSCSFLRAPSEADLDDTSIIDIGHEALIRHWDKLKGGGEIDWIREEQENAEQYRGLCRMARANVTIPPEELASIESWWVRSLPNRYWAARYERGLISDQSEDNFDDVLALLERSRSNANELEKQRIETEEAKQRTFKANAEAAAAETKRQAAEAIAAARKQRYNIIVAASIVAVVLSIGLGTQQYQKLQAKTEADRALREKEKAEERENTFGSTVLAFAAERILHPAGVTGGADAAALLLSKPDRLPNTFDYERSLLAAVGDLRETMRLVKLPGNLSGLAISPGKRLVAGVGPSQGRLTVYFWDFDTARFVDSADIAGSGSGFGNIRWSPDGSRLLLGTSPTGFVFAPCSREKLHKYFASCAGRTNDLLTSFGSPLNPAAQGVWSVDGTRILTGGFQREAKLWNSIDGAFIGAWNSADAKFDAQVGQSAQPASGLAFSSDGKRLAIGSPAGEISIIDAASLLLVKKLTPTDGQRTGSIFSLVFNPIDANRLVASTQNGLQLWDIEQGKVHPIRGSSGVSFQVVFQPAGHYFVTGSDDGTIRIFPLRENGNVEEGILLRGHRAPVFALDVSSNSIVSSTNDRTLRFWNRYSPVSPRLSNSTTSSSDIAMGRENDTVALSRGNQPAVSVRVPTRFGEVAAADMTRDRKYVVLAPQHGRLLVFSNEFPSQEALGRLRGPEEDWKAVSFEEGGKIISATTKGGATYIWPFYSSIEKLKNVAAQNLPFWRESLSTSESEERIKAPSEILCVLFNRDEDCRSAEGSHN